MRGLSVVFALTLWFFVTWDGTSLSTRVFSVPLQYQDLPEGYSLSDFVQNVEVKLEGRFQDLALLNRNDITAYVGMSDLRPGKYGLPIQLVSPSGTRVVSYTPNSVEFELFRMIERKLRPSFVVEGDMPENLSLASVDISPAEITIKGPESSVMAIHRAEVRGTVKDMSDGARNLKVVIVDDNGGAENFVLEPPSVRVHARFAKTMQEARIPVSVQVTGVPGDGFEVGSVVISPDTIILRGTKEALLGISELALNPIDVSGHTEGMNADIPLDPPSDAISIVGTDHVNIRVEFKNAVETRTFLGVPVKLHGVANVRRWNVLPPSVSVTVERSAMGTGAPFDPEKPPLELYVDATNVVASQLTLPILTRNVETGISVIRIDPQQVTITSVAP
jgi:YbbR domain-containing protein